MQKLILPINKAKMTASMKNATYKRTYNMTHYGVDLIAMSGGTTVYASGKGEVLAVGYDNVCGNIVVIKYENAFNHKTEKSQDLIIRYFHFAKTSVSKGEKVTKDTVIGQYGATGKYVSGAHLHMEVDTDTKYPLYTPTLSGSSTFFKGGQYGAHDKTMSNPLDWMYCKTSSPDNQTYTTTKSAYIEAGDYTMKTITEL